MNKYQESLNYIIDKYMDIHYEGKPMNEDTKHALILQELIDKYNSKKNGLVEPSNMKYL